MHSVAAHLLQCLDRDLSVAALDTLTPPEAARLAGLLDHWRQLSDRRAGRPAADVSRETHTCACGGSCRHDRSKDIDALIEAGAALAQEMQVIIEEALEAAGESDPAAGTAVTELVDLVEEWEAAYARVDPGAEPVGSDLPQATRALNSPHWDGDWGRP